MIISGFLFVKIEVFKIGVLLFLVFVGLLVVLFIIKFFFLD